MISHHREKRNKDNFFPPQSSDCPQVVYVANHAKIIIFPFFLPKNGHFGACALFAIWMRPIITSPSFRRIFPKKWAFWGIVRSLGATNQSKNVLFRHSSPKNGAFGAFSAPPPITGAGTAPAGAGRAPTPAWGPPVAPRRGRRGPPGAAETAGGRRGGPPPVWRVRGGRGQPPPPPAGAGGPGVTAGVRPPGDGEGVEWRNA